MRPRLPRELFEALRNAVAALHDPPTHLTLDGLADDALQADVKPLVRDYRGGQPWPAELCGRRVSGPTEALTVHLQPELIKELRYVAVATRSTYAAVAEWALRRELERLERKYNDGQPFPRRTGELRGGRQVSSANEQWLELIKACVRRPRQKIVITDLAGRTPSEAIAHGRGVARRNPKMLQGLRVTLSAGAEGWVYVRAIRPGEEPWEEGTAADDVNLSLVEDCARVVRPGERRTFGRMTYRVATPGETPKRQDAQTASWLELIKACVRRRGQKAVLTDLGGRTPSQAISACRGVARRNPKVLRGLRLTLRAGADGLVYVRAIRPGQAAREDT